MAERGQIFKEAPIFAPNRSWFDLSYENTFSMNMGEGVPCALLECLPGDHFKAKTDSLTRFSPLLAPVMTSVNQFSYHFFVRMRDIWTQFDKFITNNDQKRTWQANVSSFTPPTMPYFKPRELTYSENRFGQSLTEHNFETGTIDFINTPKSYRLVICWEHNPSSGTDKPLYYFVDKSISSGYVMPVGTAINPQPNWAFTIIHFKPNPTEFDRTYSVGSNGIPLDYYRMNPFGAGSLCDYLGLDCSAMYQGQWDYYIKALKYVGTSAGHNNTYQLLYGLNTLNSVLSDPEVAARNSVSIFPDLVPEGVEDTSALERINLMSFSLSSLKDFFDTHAILEVDNYYTELGSVTIIGQCVSADGYGKYEGLGTALTISNSLDSITEDPLCVLPLRAYRFIYDEYFRDENYIPVNAMTDFSRDGDEFAWLGSNPSGTDLCTAIDYLSCFRKAWEHDPYTTALPGPQRGDAVHFLGNAQIKYNNSADLTKVVKAGQNLPAVAGSITIAQTGGVAYLKDSGTDWLSLQSTTAYADLSAATIENFRWANAMQKYLEKKARTGGRYYEYLLGIWNKSVDDSKLNRPIYLSGDRTPVQVSEVLQTSSTDGRSALGDMAGRAIALGNDEFIEYEVPDYGYFMEITSVIPRVAYQQGVNPAFTRENYLDFPLPDFAQLGEEYVKQKELYYTADSSKDNKAFGYQSRYYQWKYKRSEIHGEFKDTLDYWHFGRKFDSAPVAGKLFLEVDPDYRQFAVTFKGFQHLYCQMWHDIQMNRALPEYGVPVL